jgi:hypothetical protein
MKVFDLRGRRARQAKLQDGVAVQGCIRDASSSKLLNHDAPVENRSSRQRMIYIRSESRRLLVQYFVHHDSARSTSKSSRALRRFIDEHREDLHALGLIREPSPSTLRRVLKAADSEYAEATER